MKKGKNEARYTNEPKSTDLTHGIRLHLIENKHDELRLQSCGSECRGFKSHLPPHPSILKTKVVNAAVVPYCFPLFCTIIAQKAHLLHKPSRHCQLISDTLLSISLLAELR